MANDIHVLLVDDEETFVFNLARLLRFRGFEVATALDGYSATDLLRDKKGFDVAVLDVKMPGMDGLATLRQMKKIKPDIEVIMLTGHATIEDGIQSIREGAFDYLMKPCDIEDLSEKIKEACEVERIRRRPVLWNRRLVKEITRSTFMKLYTMDPLKKALEVFMREAGMPANESLYILNGADRVSGKITRRTLLDAAQKQTPERPITWEGLTREPELLPEIELGTVMQRGHPIAAGPDEKLAVVARRMIKHNVRCMPVLDESKMLGFIRLQDIFQHIGPEI